ncbi:MAG: BNR-4 repeat-containing protein [Lentisphaeria bacterium]|nr:BNR-4 repeat-containing protein [Lentisphaeria bacterium]
MRVQRDDVISTRGSTRATGYAMSCKMITEKDKTFVAWLDFLADIKMRVLDRTTGMWSDPVLVGKGVDNHSGPAMTMDSKGHICIVYGPHHGPFKFRKTLLPWDISKWGPEEKVGVFGTYPSLIRGPDDTLHLTYRGGAMPRRIMYQRKPTGKPWSEPLELVDSKAPSGYTQYGNALAIDADNCLHLVFHIYDTHPKGGKAAGYLRSPDAGRTWETVDGAKVTLPATPDTPCFFAQGKNLDMRTSNVALSKDGHPFVLTSQLKQKPTGATLWSHDGKEWQRRELLPIISKHLPGRSVGMHGTLTFDRNGRLFVTLVTAKAPGGGWGHPSWEVALLTSDDEGKTFAVQELSARNPKRAAWLSSIERPYCDKLVSMPLGVLYMRGSAGKGCTEGETSEVHALFLEE